MKQSEPEQFLTLQEIVVAARRNLAAYGYAIALTGAIDRPAMTVLRAFQQHFRQHRVDGRLDRSTFATIERLVMAIA